MPRRPFHINASLALLALLLFMMGLVLAGCAAATGGAPAVRLAVDRTEGELAVLVDDDGRTFDVPLAALPTGAREGSVLRLTIDHLDHGKRLCLPPDSTDRGPDDDSGDMGTILYAGDVGLCTPRTTRRAP